MASQEGHWTLKLVLVAIRESPQQALSGPKGWAGANAGTVTDFVL